VSFHRPEIDDTTSEYWAAAADGRLIADKCSDCGELAPYPRGFCPACWSGNVSSVELSGRGTLYTYSEVHVNPMPPFKDLVPYVAAMVDLEEGPRVLTRLVDITADELAIGMALRATFEQVDEGEGLVLFAPA
jgi:uncharacterized OB-fold protein